MCLKKILLLVCLCLNTLFAKEIIAVSLPMQKEFLQKIVGEKYEIITLVEPGVNPHDFEPKFSTIKKVNTAIAYFAIGIEFESVWLEKFKAQNKKMQIFATQKDVARINFAHNHDHHHGEGDTHIWLSVSNAKIIATNIYNALKVLDKTTNYAMQYEALMQEIAQVDAQLQEILRTLPKGQKFVVFHPMLGYFARDYGLEEISIEVEGKSPKMQDMIKVVTIIRQENLKIIFAQPEFSTKSAEFIAKESGAKLGYFSPLKTPWGENLIEFAKTLNTLQKRD